MVGFSFFDAAVASGKKKSPAVPPKEKRGVTYDDFTTFWLAYPRRVGKGAARKAWTKVPATEGLLDRMVQALAWQRQQPQWVQEGGRYIPHPATWLRQERWDDEPVPAASVSTTKATVWDIDYTPRKFQTGAKA